MGMFIPARGGLKQIGDRIVNYVTEKLRTIDECPDIKAEISARFLCLACIAF